MVSGTTRRKVVTDSLAGEAQVTPATISGPGVSTPVMPRQMPSIAGQLAAALGGWADERLKAEANKEHEADAMDGAIASMQGQTFDQLEMDGANKWALQGHRVVSAQTMSASLVAQQKQFIEDQGFELDADQYREQYVGQLETLVDGQDPRMARMIREQMVAQAPELITQHTLAYANHQEQQTFDALVRGIDAMSRDTQSVGALVSFATGGGDSAAGSLSQARLNAALVEGIVLSFQNDNPRAYGLLVASGATANLSTEELRRMEAGKTEYQNRLRREYDEVLFDGMQALKAEIASGELEPEDALNSTIRLYNQYGIEITMQEAEAAFNAAADPHRTLNKTRRLAMDGATARGSWEAFGRASVSIMQSNESAPGDPEDIEGPLIEGGANKGDKAQGLRQVMPKTGDDPGYGLTPSDGSVADNFRFGGDYWTAFAYGDEHASGGFDWPPGDIEAMAVAYNAGPGAANKWFNAGRDYSVLPDRAQTEAYAKKAVKKYNDMKAPLVGDRYNEMLRITTEAKDAADVEAYSAMMVIVGESDRQFMAGTINRQVWKGERDSARQQFGIKKTLAMANREEELIRQRMAIVNKSETDRVSDEQKSELQTRMMPLLAQWESIITDPHSYTQDELSRAMFALREGANQIFLELGLQTTDDGNTKIREAAFTQLLNAMESKYARLEEDVDISEAIVHNNVDRLNGPQKKRAYKKAYAQIHKDHEEVFLKSKQTPEDAARRDEGIAQATADLYSQFGQVDPDVVSKESATILNSLTIDGRPNAEAVQTINNYARMRATDGEVSKGYLTKKAEVRALQVMSVAGVTEGQQFQPGQIEQAIQIIADTEMRNRTDRAADFIKSAEAQDEIASEVSDYYDWKNVNLWQAFWNSDADLSEPFRNTRTEEERFLSPETRAQVGAALEREVYIAAQGQPYSKASTLVPAAMETMKRHTAVIGGSFVNFAFEQNEVMFGGNANQYATVNITDRVVSEWLASPQMREAYPELDNIDFIELLPRATQEAISGALWGLGPDFDQGMELQDARISALRGLRNYRAFTTPDGKVLKVRVFNEHGQEGEPIVIDLQSAGAYFMQTNPNF